MNFGNTDNNFQQFEQQKYVAGATDFLKSNSLLAKIAFLLLVLIGFIIALRLGSAILNLLLGFNPSPHLTDGIIPGKQMTIIPQDPNVKGAKPVMRSENEREGVAFTWSVWIFIDDNYLDHNTGKYRHIFHKGTNFPEAQSAEAIKGMPGINYPNNGPGLYIAADTNELVILMNTFKNISETINIPDIPLNKWVNCMIRCENTTLDVFINGNIVKRHQLEGVPKQNYGNVYMSMNGGFSGYTSDLWYFNYALGTTAIQKIVDDGPSLKMNSDTLTKSKPHYLSLRWYFKGAGDQYNPVS